MKGTILHIDMDAFYAAIEQLDNPRLRGKPVIVGGGMRGVVSTASYEAREFGVHSAMPIFQAKRLCPRAVFVPVRMSRYQETSRRIMAFLNTISPVCEQVSIDEAYLDITGTERLLGDPIALAKRIKEWVREETGLTCSIGIAPNKFVAKIASDWDKPDGLTMIRHDEVEDFLDDLPVTKLPGVGKRALKTLEGLGITQAGQIRKLPEAILTKKFGKFGRSLLELSRGLDPSAVVSHGEPKSISNENTLGEDTDDIEILMKTLAAQSETIGRRIRTHGLRGRTITLKLKYSDFRLVTRARTIDGPTNSTKIIRDTAFELLKNEQLRSKVRLVGVGVSNFQSSARQLAFFEKLSIEDERQSRLDMAIDEVSGKFGRDKLKRGR